MPETLDAAENTQTAHAHQPPFRVLVTIPATNMRGGVGQYMRILRPYWGNEVEYFQIGSRADQEPRLRTALRLVRDSASFAQTLRRGDHSLVHLNPSIYQKALVRDGILLLIAKAQGKRVVVFAHGWNPAWADGFPTAIRWLFRFVYGRADAFIVLGKCFEKRIRQLGFTGPVFVEGAPIEDDLVNETGEDIKQQTAASKRLFRILFLARIERDKGIYEALETYQILKSRYPSISLTVAGDGSELTSARQYAAGLNLKGVSFPGHVEGIEKRRVLASADAYLFPSHHEGLPLSVLEAMACGLPIVASDVGSLRDFFEEGTMGFLAPHPYPELLAPCLEGLIRDPDLCQRIAQFNRRYARMHFTARHIATSIERTYGLLLGRADQAFLCTG